MTAHLPDFKKFILTLFALSLPLAAQTGLGIVTGTVTDPSKGTDFQVQGANPHSGCYGSGEHGAG
jgi:hypothetical protein